MKTEKLNVDEVSGLQSATNRRRCPVLSPTDASNRTGSASAVAVQSHRIIPRFTHVLVTCFVSVSLTGCAILRDNNVTESIPSPAAADSPAQSSIEAAGTAAAATSETVSGTEARTVAGTEAGTESSPVADTSGIPMTAAIPVVYEKDKVCPPNTVSVETNAQCKPLPIVRRKTECELELERVHQDLKLLRAQSEQDRKVSETLAVAIQSLNQQMGRLSKELDFWTAEVSRLDREVRKQQEQDLESLEALAELISQIPVPEATE